MAKTIPVFFPEEPHLVPVELEENPVPLIYVAGPYGDKDGYLAIDRNIAVARVGAAWITDNGMFFLCPHMNSAHFEVITPEATIAHWYGQDLRLMSACDAMIVVGNWRESRGVKKELEVAEEAGLPVFDFTRVEDCQALLDWRDAWVAERTKTGRQL